MPAVRVPIGECSVSVCAFALAQEISASSVLAKKLNIYSGPRRLVKFKFVCFLPCFAGQMIIIITTYERGSRGVYEDDALRKVKKRNPDCI